MDSKCKNCAGIPWRRGSKKGHICKECRKPYRPENLRKIEEFMFKSEVGNQSYPPPPKRYGI